MAISQDNVYSAVIMKLPLWEFIWRVMGCKLDQAIWEITYINKSNMQWNNDEFVAAVSEMRTDLDDKMS